MLGLSPAPVRAIMVAGAHSVSSRRLQEQSDVYAHENLERPHHAVRAVIQCLNKEGILMMLRDSVIIYNKKISEPAVVFDKETGTYYRMGEYEEMKTYFELVVKAYKLYGYHEFADSKVLLKLPKDQEAIDKVFNNSGYLKLYYKELMKNEQD